MTRQRFSPLAALLAVGALALVSVSVVACAGGGDQPGTSADDLRSETDAGAALDATDGSSSDVPRCSSPNSDENGSCADPLPPSCLPHYSSCVFGSECCSGFCSGGPGERRMCW